MRKTHYCKPTFPKNLVKGDALVDDVRGGEPLFEREAKFLMILRGEPDLRRLGDDDDLFIIFDNGLFLANNSFLFSIFSPITPSLEIFCSTKSVRL